MENKLLRTSLFGYSKTDVCEYISRMSDELCAGHTEEKHALEDELRALRAEKDALEEKCGELQRQLDELRANAEKKADETAEISAILIDARNFADELKSKATARNIAEMEENSKQNAAVSEKIARSCERVDAIRAYLREILEETDKKLEDVAERLDNENCTID